MLTAGKAQSYIATAGISNGNESFDTLAIGVSVASVFLGSRHRICHAARADLYSVGVVWCQPATVVSINSRLMCHVMQVDFAGLTCQALMWYKLAQDRLACRQFVATACTELGPELN